MNRYKGLKEDILKVNGEFERIITAASHFPGVSEDSFNSWKKICSGIQRQICEDQVRVAVVGAIKSGKSTFVNSLFRHDYLKRGAGVITSIVTRIHCSDRLKATLRFKSWDEVNREIEHALSLIGSGMDDGSGFDLRNTADREKLAGILEELTTDQLIDNDARNIHTVLMDSYLSGYESVREIVGPEPVVIEYGEEEFDEHRKFSGDEILAVYLNDIKIDIRADLWDGSIEIADCQGSDSPNPLHLAMIQDYLLRTNLVVYVISSRTGLRRADIRFLTMIRDMGMMDHMLFVVNCDFTEHDSPEDLNQLVVKIRRELCLVCKDPKVFTISALYNLFKAAGNETLSPKDRLRLQQWEMDGAFTRLSDHQTERFTGAINGQLIEERNALLLNNHVERHDVVASGLGRWVAVNRDMLTRDARSAGKVMEKISLHSTRMEYVKSMIRKTLAGAESQVRLDLSRQLDQFLYDRNDSIEAQIKKYIKSYTVPCDRYLTDPEDEKRFVPAVFQAYQEFRRNFDSWLAERIAPQIIRFVKKSEAMIAENIEVKTRPCAAIVDGAIAEYMETVTGFGLSLAHEDRTGIPFPEIDEIKKIHGLTLPPVSTVMEYSVQIKTEAVLRLGTYNVFNLFRKIFKTGAQDKKDLKVKALEDAVERMKRETEKSMTTYFRNYKRIIRRDYFNKFIHATSDGIYDTLVEGFQSYLTDQSKVTDRIAEKKEDKEQLLEFLDTMNTDLVELSARIRDIKAGI